MNWLMQSNEKEQESKSMDNVMDEKEKDEYIKSVIKKKFAWNIKTISEYSKKYNLSIKQMVDEVKNKTSKLSKSNRDLLLILSEKTLTDLF